MNVFCLLYIEADLIQAKDHLLTLLSGHMTEGQRSALCLLQQLCRIDGKIYLKKFVMHFVLMKFLVAIQLLLVNSKFYTYIYINLVHVFIIKSMESQMDK